MSDIGRYRRIFSNDFLEESFQRLDDHQRVIWLYAQAGPQSTSVGIYRLSTAIAVEELRTVNAEEFERRLTDVCEACDWRFDASVRVLWIPGWVERNPPQSANVVTSWRKLLGNVPDCPIKLEAVTAIHRYLKESPLIKNHQGYLDAFGDLPQRLRATFKRSETQPQAQPGSHQGSGIRDLSGSRETGALARVGAYGTDVRTIAIAAVNLEDTNASIETLRNSFMRFWDREHQGRPVADESIEAALNDARRRTA